MGYPISVLQKLCIARRIVFTSPVYNKTVTGEEVTLKLPYSYIKYDSKWGMENVQRIMELYNKTHRQQSCSICISSVNDYRMDDSRRRCRTPCVCLYQYRYQLSSGRSDLRRRICRIDIGIVWRMPVPL